MPRPKIPITKKKIAVQCYVYYEDMQKYVNSKLANIKMLQKLVRKKIENNIQEQLKQQKQC